MNRSAWAAEDAPSMTIILVVGVNGAGKTTSIAKLAHAFKSDGATRHPRRGRHLPRGRHRPAQGLGRPHRRARRRAPARRRPRARSSSTRLTAAESATADFVIIDTAGRLHTKTNLMEELKKMHRIIQRNHPDGPHETFLVLDATTGQNGLMQAKTFAEAVGVTGIVLAKLDGTAKGGIAFAIAHELGIPVRFIGTGEKMGDLAPFDAEDFVDSLLA